MNLRQKQKGFTLIEALIGATILMVGLLGVANLLMKSLVTTEQASRYTVASALAQQIISDARGNSAAIASYATDLGSGGTSNSCYSTGGTSPTVCTSLQQAQDDIYKWKQLLSANLPEGDGQVTVTPNGSTSCTGAQSAGNMTGLQVIVQWQEKGAVLKYCVVAWI